MADLLIPLLVLFGIFGLVLIGALVHQLRDVDASPGRPGGGSPRAEDRAPVLPWQRQSQEQAPVARRPPPPQPKQDAQERPPPAPAPAPSREPARPSLPWQQAQDEDSPQPTVSPPPSKPSFPSVPWRRKGAESSDRRPPAPASQPASSPRQGAEEERSSDRAAPLWNRGSRDAPAERAAPAGRRGRCSTCGGSGRAVVQGSGGALQQGPCPDCQR